MQCVLNKATVKLYGERVGVDSSMNLLGRYVNIPCAKDILHRVKERLLENFDPVLDDGTTPLWVGACRFNLEWDQLRPIVEETVDHYRRAFTSFKREMLERDDNSLEACMAEP